MNDRERFVATMHYESVDRPVLWEWGAWGETIRRWQREGGFEGPPPEYQECDRRENAGVNFGLVAPFARQVLADDGRTITYINEKGQLLRDFHNAESSMPEFMKYPVENRADWERLTERIDVVFVDTDGHVDELIPLFLEAGVRGIYPMEVNAGMDVARLRREYGRDLLMTGGIDKRALAAGPEAIETELVRCIPVAIEGGYIPTVDHSLPPDISYANFQYYWRRKKEMLGIA